MSSSFKKIIYINQSKALANLITKVRIQAYIIQDYEHGKWKATSVETEQRWNKIAKDSHQMTKKKNIQVKTYQNNRY